MDMESGKQEMVEAEAQHMPGLRDLLAILQRRMWWFIATFLVVVGGAAAITFSATPIYEARAKLLVEPDAGARRGMPEVFSDITHFIRARNVETVIEVVESPEVLVPAAEAAGVELDTLLLHIRVEPVRATDILWISCESPDPMQAVRMANAVAEKYVELTLDWRQRGARQARGFVMEQLATAEARLARAEEALTEFSRQAGAYAVEAAANSQLERRQEQEAAVRQLEAEVAAGEAELAAIRRKLRNESEFLTGSRVMQRNPVLDGLRAELGNLETERAGLLEVYAPTNERVRALDRRMDEIRRLMATETERQIGSEQLVNPVDADLTRRMAMAEVDLRGTRERAAAARRTLRDIDARVERIPQDQRTAAELRRELDIAEKAYLTLKQREQELLLAEAFEIPGATVLEKAQPPRFPIKPNKQRNLMLAAYLGLMVAIGVVLLVHYWDDTFGSVEELEQAVGLPVLSLIYHMKGTRPILTALPSRSPFAEAFRILRSALRFSTVKRPISTLVVTGPDISAGKSTTALNLAIACAQAGQRTILVDADLRRPSLHRVLELSNNRGLTNCVIEDQDPAELLQETQCADLRFLSTGPLPPNPAELFESENMHKVIERLSGISDLVVFDASSAMTLVDAQVLARRCDGCLLVLSLDQTKRPVLKRLVDVLAREGIYMPGIVLNKMHRAAGGYYYYYHYHYQRQYGEDDTNAQKPSASA